MATFLELNGLPIPVSAEQFTNTKESIGSRGRAFDGTLRSTRRALKDMWQGRTIRLPRDKAEALCAMLMGEGDVFQYIDDFFSSKGLGPDTGAVATLMGFGTDGGPVKDEAPFDGVGSVFVDSGTTNNATIQDLDGTSGSFSDVADCFFADVSTRSHSGAGCVQIRFDDAVNATRAECTVGVDVTAPATATHTVSFYVRGGKVAGSAGQITQVGARFTVEDTTNVVSSTTSVVQALTDKWQRVEIQITTGAVGLATLILRIEEDTIDAGGYIYIDSLQSEYSQSFARPFVVGTRAAPDLQYQIPNDIAGGQAIVTNFWTRGPIDLTGTNEWVTIFNDPPSLSEYEIRQLGGNIQFFTRNDELFDMAISTTAPAWDGFTWYMITTVLIYDEDLAKISGRQNMELYLNGSLVASTTADASALPNKENPTFTRLDIGNRAGGQIAEADIADLQILPYVPTKEMIGYWYSSGRAVGANPALRARGTFLHRPEALVEATVGSRPNLPFIEGGVYQENGQEVEFRLQEI